MVRVRGSPSLAASPRLQSSTVRPSGAAARSGLVLALDRPGQLTRGIGLDFDLDLPVRAGDAHRRGLRGLGVARSCRTSGGLADTSAGDES